jgi:predicted GNAT family N-acyltransferase
MVTYRRITTADPEYKLEKDLRNRVLRVPLGLTLSATDVQGEDAQMHIVAMDEGGRMVGCVLLVFPGDGTARVRHVAVEPHCRRTGIGAGMMEQAENAAREKGVRKITMHARLYARGFYERLGYRAASDIFTEVTIPHISMEKTLEEDIPQGG